MDLEAPLFPPEPLTDAAAGPTLVSGEEETGLVTGMTASVGPTVRGRPAPATRASPPAPRRGEATVSGHAPTRVAASAAPPAAPARAAGGTAVRPSPPPRPVSRTHPALYAVLGGMGAALVAAGSYIYWSRTQQAPPLPSTSATLASAPSEPPATMAQTAAPPSTPAATLPPATVVDAHKPSAASVRAAHAAFGRQDYERAIGLAQTALRADPGNAAAQKVLDNALAGQGAGARFRTAEAALAGGDLKLAASEIEAARAGLPGTAAAPPCCSGSTRPNARSRRARRRPSRMPSRGRNSRPSSRPSKRRRSWRLKSAICCRAPRVRWASSATTPRSRSMIRCSPSSPRTSGRASGGAAP